MKKSNSKIVIIIGCINIILVFLVISLLKYYKLLPDRKYTNEHFHIETYKSSVDKDLDKIDDQTDIILGAREYIKKKPKYKSKYYNGGFPTDNYGVCTDVVVNSFLSAGYNLKELLDKDIKENKEKYNIEKVDSNIDFRRVKNLKVYLDNNAIKLTTNIYDIEKWQGGDIVVFKKHIGIVSDKRNKKGISYVIHHSDIAQIYYEEDILENRKEDIIGHYRIN